MAVNKMYGSEDLLFLKPLNRENSMLNNARNGMVNYADGKLIFNFFYLA